MISTIQRHLQTLPQTLPVVTTVTLMGLETGTGVSGSGLGVGGGVKTGLEDRVAETW